MRDVASAACFTCACSQQAWFTVHGAWYRRAVSVRCTPALSIASRVRVDSGCAPGVCMCLQQTCAASVREHAVLALRKTLAPGSKGVMVGRPAAQSPRHSHAGASSAAATPAPPPASLPPRSLPPAHPGLSPSHPSSSLLAVPSSAPESAAAAHPRGVPAACAGLPAHAHCCSDAALSLAPGVLAHVSSGTGAPAFRSTAAGTTPPRRLAGARRAPEPMVAKQLGRAVGS
jgi:hypothetical protein